MLSIHSNQSSCCALLHFLSKCQSLCYDSWSVFQRLMRTPWVIFVSDKKAEIVLFARNGEVLLHAWLILANSDQFWSNSLVLSLYRNDARLPGFSAPFVWLFSLLVSFARLFLNSLDRLCGTAVTKEMEEVVIFFMRPSTSSHVDFSTTLRHRHHGNTLNCWSGYCTISRRYILWVLVHLLSAGSSLWQSMCGKMQIADVCIFSSLTFHKNLQPKKNTNTTEALCGLSLFYFRRDVGLKNIEI